MASFLFTFERRDELEAAQAANEVYSPLKIILAVFGIISVVMLFTVICWFAWSRYQRKWALEQQYAQDVAMSELFGGSQHVKNLKEGEFEDINLNNEERRTKGVTRWSFSGYFGKQV
ncbi:uncharacterized protein N0V89_005853 [Didymosphaeria variabile]|uniref:Uncharacterized protein n=1 Tax=Didymosphaeria variabile TaxID=1932322 RepID=A0A9W8XNZ1_9PLEO|nr:uncharacterized protein N0V89_005853 [Didymosphaeria variabile]KAJ4354120.1 hypothetical protein N0V89_005853 [Didymosphaeria variabile]